MQRLAGGRERRRVGVVRLSSRKRLIALFSGGWVLSGRQIALKPVSLQLPGNDASGPSCQRRRQSAKEVAEIVSQRMKLETDSIGRERLA
jgi:hypothetical protein